MLFEITTAEELILILFTSLKSSFLLQSISCAYQGFPWIDAIMTQLREEGWIHHLARHAVACFLTRGDLWVSWEEGMKVQAIFVNLQIPPFLSSWKLETSDGSIRSIPLVFLYVSMYVSRANDSILLRSICKTDLFPHSFLPSPISIYVSPVAFVGLLTLFYLINEIDVAGVRGVVAWRGLERERWYLVVALLLIFLPTGTNILQKLKYLLPFLRPFVWPFFCSDPLDVFDETNAAQTL